MLSIPQLKEKYPEFEQIGDVTLAERMHRRFYPELPKDNYMRFVLGVKKPETEDVPPPDESKLGQAETALKSIVNKAKTTDLRDISDILQNPLAIAAKSPRRTEAALDIGLRKATGLPVSEELKQEVISPQETKLLDFISTQGRLRETTGELLGPERTFEEQLESGRLPGGVIAAEMFRGPIKEIAELTGFILRPDQWLVVGPAFGIVLKTLGAGIKAGTAGTRVGIKKLIDVVRRSGVKKGEKVEAVAEKIVKQAKKEPPITKADIATEAKIESGSKETNKTVDKVRKLIDDRLEGRGERYTPGTGRLAPERGNKIQEAEIFGKTPEGKADAIEKEAFDDVSDFFGKAKAGVYGEFGGFAKSKIAQKPPLVEMPELVEIAKNITGKYPGVKKKLIRGMQALGVARVPEGKGAATINLFAGMFKDPQVSAKVLAHEIGHVVDWLPQKTMSRGNILGKIASLKKYMKSLLEEYPGAPGPLTPKDRSRIRRLAKKMAEQGQRAIPKVTPEDVLAIWRDVKSFEKNRALNDYIAGLTRQQKSEIMKTAIKGKLPEWADFAQAYKTAAPDSRALYRKLLKEEIEKRRLFEKDTILKELKALTQKWKPFKEGLKPGYTKYRYSNEELYADAVSVLLNEPELLRSTSPNFYKAFFNFLERKPEFKRTYLGILERSKKGSVELLEKRDKDLNKMFEKGEAVRREGLKPEPRDIGGVLKRELVDVNAPRIKKLKQAQAKGIKIRPEENPIYWAEEYPYTHAAYFEYLRTVENSIRKPLNKIGLVDEDFGKYLLLRRITTERAGLANPLGHTPETATKHLEFMKTKMGAEKFAQLEKAAQEFSRARAEHIIPVLKAAEMYDPKLQKFIENNIENYARFDVLSYLEQKYGRESTGRLYQQIGTLQEIDNPLTATILQDAALMRAAATKMERKSFVDMMGKAFPDEIKQADRVWNGKFRAPVKPKDPKQGMISYLHKGEVEAYYLPKEIANNFNKEGLEAGKIVRGIQIVTAPLKEIFVGKNPFWMVWNIQRDIRALAKNLPKSNMLKALWYTGKSIPDAAKDVFLNKSTEAVSEMYKQKMLISGRYYAALDQSPEKMLDKVIKSYGLKGQTYENKVVKPFVKFWEYLDRPGRFSERITKIAGFKMLKKLPVKELPTAKRFAQKPPEGFARQSMGLETEKEIAHIVRTQSGSPDFLRGGHLNPLYNSLYLFSNAGVQGWRASFEAARTSPLSYTWKTVKYDIMPKLMMYGAGVGVLGPKIKRMMDNISEHDKSNYLTIPLGMTKSGKTIYFIIPHGFMGQATAGTLWKIINASKSKDITDLADYMGGGLPYSSLNPILGAGIDTMRYVSGKNPYDNWSGRYVIPENVFEAGGKRSHKAFIRHLWNNLGGSVLYRFKYEDVEKIKGELEKLYDYPITSSGLSRFIRVSDYGVREQLREAKLEERQINANELLDAKDVLYKIMNEKPLTEKDRIALRKKPGLVKDISLLKLLARKHGEVALEEYLSASSIRERMAVLKKWQEIQGGKGTPKGN